MRFGFVTCVQLGFSCIKAIYEIGGELNLAITLLDEVAPNKSGRVKLDDFCSEHKIPILKVRHINDPQTLAAIQQADLDWLFIIGWSQIASAELLAIPKQGVLGMHPTLLPQGRGRAAVPHAILQGLTKTGVTLFKLDQGVDTGPIALQIELPLATDETATSLYQRVNEAHVTLIKQAWPLLSNNQLKLHAQQENLATVWPGRTPEEGRITPQMTCLQVERLVRAVTRPYPGAFYDDPSTQQRWHIWAGKLVKEPVGNVPFIKLADGFYQVLEYDLEELNYKESVC